MRSPLLLYYGSLLCFLPGALLALYYAAVARLATSASLGDLLGRFVGALEWLVDWRFLLLLVPPVFLALAGAIPAWRRWGSGLLAALSAAALAAILFLPPDWPGLGEAPFALGLILALAGSARVARKG